ncbi:hypothetical protein Vadar_011115 [Vaccinium darrowii]|uniref:Uncharacterized protein n=1 Tax=Vaccinium darrowii TaxID=229202 RepID=A0ACB7XZP4_9ERIC|nr:hypothetical protein Vadar_011115 [Vaccinium darrowii]
MTAVKLAVAKCSEESQSVIIQKALDVLFLSAAFPSEESISGFKSSKLEASQLNHGLNSYPSQALGSMVNKLPLKSNTMETSDVYSLEEAFDIIFSNGLLRRFCGTSNGSEIDLAGLRLSNFGSRLLQVHAIIGPAWTGKALLRRAQETDFDAVLMTFERVLNCYTISDQCCIARLPSDTPLSAILSKVKKLIPLLADSLSAVSEDISNSEIIYSVLLVLSGILTDKTACPRDSNSVSCCNVFATPYKDIPHEITGHRYYELYQMLLMIRKRLYDKKLLDVGKNGQQLHLGVFNFEKA